MKAKLLILSFCLCLISSGYANSQTPETSKSSASANKEPGCKSYQLYQDPYDNNKFVFVEEYKNQAAVDAHFASDYFKAFGPKMNDLVAEPGKIKIITVDKEEIK